MFEWGDGCLWCRDDFTRKAHGIGPVENKLPLSEKTVNRLGGMQIWHETILDWNDPTGPLLWDTAEFEKFEDAVAVITDEIEKELGPKFDLKYVQLGSAVQF